MTEDEEALTEAVLAAKEEFNETISSYGFDPAYFSVDVEAYQLSRDFEPFRHKIKLEDVERTYNYEQT